MGGRDRGFGVPAAALDAVVAGGQVGAFGAHDRLGGLGQGSAEPLGSLAGFAGVLFAAGFALAGADPAPGGEVRVGREAAHVGADLGQQHLGGALVDAGDRVEQLQLMGERAGQLLDLRGQGCDRLIEEVDLRQHLSDQQRVMAGEAALERLPERGDLLAQRALGQLGEDLGVMGPGDQRVEHPPGGHAEHLGGDRGA